jgi:hypothetical protein
VQVLSIVHWIVKMLLIFHIGSPDILANRGLDI